MIYFPNPKRNSKIVIDKKRQNDLKTHINIPDEVSAPIKKGDILGEMIITLDGEVLSNIKLIAKEEVRKKKATDYFIYLVSNLMNKSIG